MATTTYLFGQTVRLVAVVRGDANVLADPATLSLTVTQPDTTTITKVIGDFTKVSTGSYLYDFIPTQPGAHSYRIVATVPSDAFEGTFTVEAAGSHIDDPVSLADAKAHLNMSADTEDDAELQRTISVALARISRAVGTTLTPQTVVEDYINPGLTIVLRKEQATAFTSATSTCYNVGDATTFAAEWELVDGVLYQRPSVGGLPQQAQPWKVTVTYTAGFAIPLPDDLWEAILEFVRHLWETQQGSRGGGMNPDMMRGGGPTDLVAYANRLLPPRVQQLLEPFRPAGRVG